MGNTQVTAQSEQIAPESPAITQDLTTKGPEADAKPKKKICCACPETKKLRDECIVQHGENKCGKYIEAHKQCLRAEGFNV
ncbi:cytochrome c oxidase copper chaperone-like [Asparagus officinalis]|uniref:cytochrome c oxidase copper chaperone-like n=1 Tax=Asparagus officinalis TaxID=4686 RepID=UPI00098E413C|nr:cytochrome c oxidase copper chaperone-like [Asparagus officinalis]